MGRNRIVLLLEAVVSDPDTSDSLGPDEESGEAIDIEQAPIDTALQDGIEDEAG